MSTTPTLAEAIRIGAAATDQIRGTYMVRPEETYSRFQTCVVGSIYYALGHRWVPTWRNPGNPIFDPTPEEVYPELEVRVSHPVAPEMPMCRLWSVLISLNDDHGWSREKIADWVESLPDSERE